ncbi:hypothetical protein EDD21DRAFT_10034 [Dissophora ornata]|nr:hypothetical protein EDD21DRAFT_10034 [Dissophora ornata]
MIHPKILPHLTLDGTSVRFHSCRLGPTCGYGGAGGEHSSVRELIRIQPNVAWFSAMLQKEREGERQREGDNILAQGKVVGRDYSFKIKERLPPSIGKRDDLCYYINYACHASLSELQQLVKLVSPRAIFPCVLHRDITFGTFFRSNREIVALLAQSMPAKSFSLDVEEYKDRRWPCLADGISTDFQSFHHAKGGYNVLDMNDEIQGIHPANVRQGDLNAGVMVVLDDGDDENRIPSGYEANGKTTAPIAILSPRSNHLRKKMDRLRRQLRNTASLEEELDKGGLIEDSTMDEGPLSLDLEAIERKRKWWLESERGTVMTQDEEHTTGEGTELQYSGVQSSLDLQSNVGRQSGGPRSLILNGLESVADEINVHKGDSGKKEEDTPTAEAWRDQSTLELGLEIVEESEDEEERWDVQSTRSRTSEGYLSSSPDFIPSLTSFTENIFRDTTYPDSPESGSIPNLPPLLVPVPVPTPAPLSKPVIAQMNAEIEAALTTEHIPISSIFSPPFSSLDAIQQGLLYSMPSLLRTPPLRPSGHDCKIDLGDSPSKPRLDSVILPPPLLSALVSYTSSTVSSRKRAQEPIKSIFAQLAWSPPLQPTRTTQPNGSTTPISTAQLTRTQTDPRHGLQRAPKRHFSTMRGAKRARTVAMDDGKEVILIESSDDDGDRVEGCGGGGGLFDT